MCGIGGLIDYGRGARVWSDVGRRMARALTPRGPDTGGQYLDDSALLVHRRLIVVDPTGGAQPMESPDGNIILIYNGELYNTEDLRVLLLAKGHTFRGHSDTEVLLHAYLEWGTAAFEKLNGIYALSLIHIWQPVAEADGIYCLTVSVKPLENHVRQAQITVSPVQGGQPVAELSVCEYVGTAAKEADG